MIDQSLIAKVVSLSPAERLELIGAVWDSLAPEDIPVRDAEKGLLDARIAEMERNPDDQSPWPDVKARLERLLQ
jgi:putative addiction module component (TIGR02574 family)